jgi:hypothetical protein
MYKQLNHHLHIVIREEKEVTNMAHIIDYEATRPIKKVGERTFPIPPFRGVKLASIQLRIPRMDSRNNQVELIGTVGVRGLTGITQILFRIFRDGVEIFNAQAGIESADSEELYIETFQAIDKRLSAGFHVYDLTVESLTDVALGTAEVVGPITFSGLAIGQSGRNFC